MTTVISVRGKKRAELLADPNFIYVGRRVRWTEWEDSIWGNPFYRGMQPMAAMRLFDSLPDGDVRRETLLIVDGPFTVQDAVEWYEAYVKARRSLWDRLHELRGKRLGCWCAYWSPGGPVVTPCHAIVLARLADQSEPSP